MKIIRVFPRKTKATPIDDLVRFGPPGLFDEADEIHVSVTFSYDLPKAEELAKQWGCVALVKIGGPATGDKGSEFVSGMYLKPGYIITSRGCPNNCWFCVERGTGIRELEIKDGFNVLDSNLLACSHDHIMAVFKMLGIQKHRPMFTGGLETKRFTPEIAAKIRELRPDQMYFAYDTPDDYEPLIEAGKILDAVGFPRKRHNRGCYVLCGYRGDTFEKASIRLKRVIDAGFTPMAMLWKNEAGETDIVWRRFQRLWARPSIIYGRIK